MRSLISKYLLFIFVSSLFLSADTLTRTKVAMGTFVSVSLEEKNKHFIEDAFDIINDVELSLSSYKPQAKIYKLNKNKKVDLDKYIYEALQSSTNYYEVSNGYFDITVGSITKDLYKFGEVEMLPSDAELKNASVNFKGLFFNEKLAHIEKDMKIDLGGMGKGFAVDKVIEYLKLKNIKIARVAASGDIRCVDKCAIQVEDPFSEETMISFETLVKDIGISTSGNYNRYVISKKHNHLVNPKLKESQTNFVSITLISEMKNADLDAYATAASVMPITLAYTFLNKLELAFIVMQSDKTLRFSDNISNYVKNLVIHDRMKK
ncbi:FAD:protein FMN transferase [Sulfurimonas sp.]|nr:FAD:protein FMN transferase [Sulfurimonas sp.]